MVRYLKNDASRLYISNLKRGASAAIMRKLVKRQLPNSALSRNITSPSVNNSLNPFWISICPCPLLQTFVSTISNEVIRSV